MSFIELLLLFGTSFVGALVPIVNVEAAVVVFVTNAGGGTTALLVGSMTAAVGTMLGKLQVYLIAREGRAYGAKWMQRRAERDAEKAKVKAEARAEKAAVRAAADAANPPGPARRALRRGGHLLIGRNTEKAGVAVTFVSAFTGIPPFAIVAIVAGAGRMKWWLFFVTGVAGRFLRFAVGTVVFEYLVELWRSTF